MTSASVEELRREVLSILERSDLSQTERVQLNSYADPSLISQITPEGRGRILKVTQYVYGTPNLAPISDEQLWAAISPLKGGDPRQQFELIRAQPADARIRLSHFIVEYAKLAPAIS